MKAGLRSALAGCVVATVPVTAAVAEAVSFEAVMVPQEQIRLDFQDGSGHFVLMVRREGVAEGSGPLAGAAVTEHGWHDIQPGIGGDPRGYLTFAQADGMAWLKWTVRAVFVPGPDGTPVLLDNGFWEVAGASGSLAGLKGAGTMHIRPAPETEDPADRRFILDGDLVMP